MGKAVVSVLGVEQVMARGRPTFAPPDWAGGGNFNRSGPEMVMNGDRHTPDPPSR